MVYKSVDHGKLWSICFLQQHLFLVPCEVKQPALLDMLSHFHGLDTLTDHGSRPISAGGFAWLFNNYSSSPNGLLVNSP